MTTVKWSLKEGIELVGREWRNQQAAVAAVALVHGLGEHCGRYDHVARAMNEAGINVMAMDMRGHGLSSGKRGHIPSFELAVSDISLLIQETKQRNPGVPIFLYGHSMGGLLTLYWGLNNPDIVKGIISSSPGLRPGTPISPVKKALGQVLYNLVPTFTMENGLNLNGLSRDPQVVEAYRNDPLVHPFVSARLGIDIIQKGEWVIENAKNFSHPLLLLQGSRDLLASPQATRDFAEMLKGKITFSWWEGLFHELHNEKEKDQVIGTIIKWIESNK